MPDNDSTSFDLDLETAYRQAWQAVSATDLPGLDDWDHDANDSDNPDLLPFPPASVDASEADVAEQAKPQTPTLLSPRVTPRQIIEASLFVGGVELTAERLAALLKGEFTSEFVVRTIDELNRRYASEDRPYEITCSENLYRLSLKDEYEPLRRRVYGLGPKEVKLSQDALEILSLIAYRQPISRIGIETIREGNAGNVLRQLVRRQLVAVQRNDDATDPCYITTQRFLEVFGVADLDELPRAEDLTFK